MIEIEIPGLLLSWSNMGAGTVAIDETLVRTEEFARLCTAKIGITGFAIARSRKLD